MVLLLKSDSNRDRLEDLGGVLECIRKFVFTVGHFTVTGTRHRQRRF